MATIHFVSGKTLKISKKEFDLIAPKLLKGGVRLMKLATGDLVPLNSNTMEFIEKGKETELFYDRQAAMDEAKDLIDKNFDNLLKKKESPKPEPVEEAKPEPVEEKTDIIEPKKEEKPLTDEERRNKMLQDIIDKSNCKHEQEKLEMYKQETKQGLKYFPVCSYCGLRHRYISPKKIEDGLLPEWTMNDIIEAKEWSK